MKITYFSHLIPRGVDQILERHRAIISALQVFDFMQTQVDCVKP